VEISIKIGKTPSLIRAKGRRTLFYVGHGVFQILMEILTKK